MEPLRWCTNFSLHVCLNHTHSTFPTSVSTHLHSSIGHLHKVICGLLPLLLTRSPFA